MKFNSAKVLSMVIKRQIDGSASVVN